ncbi:MAG TPA: hypothetical protein VKG84_07160 [Candidatus Acidoferrales bacterium]|nr:hypothetical protein [Candidatus Acidoferrales bacterium]
MSNKNLCLVPAHWTAREVQSHRCNDGSHIHITHMERREMLAAGLVEYVLFPRVLRLMRTVPIRGLSAKTGAYLAVQVYRGRPWARVMLADMLRSTAAP